MAEVTALRNNALPYPVYGVPYGVAFPILDADGDLVTGAAGLDSEVSLNGDTFANCTNEATEIATSSGVYYLLLTGAEMTADVVTVIVKTSTSGAKTTVVTLYPRKLVPLRAGTSAGGDVGYITLDASAGALNDLWNGCLCVAVIDSNTEARIIDDYTGSNQQASVTPDWNVAPDADDTFVLYLPEGQQIPSVNTVAVSGASQTARDLGAAVTLTADYDAAKTAATQTSVNTIDDFLDTEVAAILAAVDTEVAAIKAKTDNLPASPAAVGSAMTLANDSITADAVADTGANEIADALLNRNMATGSDSGSETVRTVRQALRFLRNKWGVSGTTLTVYKEDDTAASWTATVTTDAAANPITANDPTST